MQVGCIGIGIMGSGMTRNLLKAGHQVAIWNRTKFRAEAIEGAIVLDSPRDVGKATSVVMICVSDTPDVEAVVFGSDGLLEGLSPGSLIVDCSTISPSATREFAKRAAAGQISWVDAPVSGGSEGATKGTLSIMAGGANDDIARAMPMFEAMGSTITHVGGIGAGQTVKIVNQILVAVNQLAVSEALLMAQAADVDLNKALSAVENGAAGSWMLSNRAPQMIERDWEPGFTIDLQQKDLRLVLEAADDRGVPLPGTALVFQMYRALQQQGLGGEGNHALVKALEKMSGFKLGGD